MGRNSGQPGRICEKACFGRNDPAWKNAKIVLERDSAGYVLNVSCGDAVMEGERFRQLFGLASSCFSIREESGKIYLQTKGIGHGLGFDQYQADLLAGQGKTWKELLGTFFEGLDIVGK